MGGSYLVGSEIEQPGDEIVGLLSTNLQESADEARKIVAVVTNTEHTPNKPQKTIKSSFVSH